MSKNLSEQIHNLASNAFNAGAIVELAMSKIEDSSCDCMDDDVFLSLMAVKQYLHDSVGLPLTKLADSKEITRLVQGGSDEH